MAQEIAITPNICEIISVDNLANENYINIKQGADWIEIDRESVPALIAALTQLSKQP